MTSKNKRLSRFLNNPTTSNYKEIDYLLTTNGFIKIYAKGSHMKFKHKNSRHDLIIPIHNNDCKPFYKKLAAKIIKELITSKNG